MAAAKQICTQCGYEGRGKHAQGGRGGAARILGILLMLPVHTIWKLFAARGGKFCPHCQCRTMVKSESAEGIFARRKFDVELGLVAKPTLRTKPNPVAFGSEKPKETIVRKPVNPEEW